jgi:hypoxanthine phosphoribosyltransferase
VKLAEYGEAVGRRLYSAQEIAGAVDRIAHELATDYAGKPLLLVGVLKGALCFTADLARALAGRPGGPSEIMVDYVCVQRYGAAGRVGGQVGLSLDASLPVTGENVVIVEDIVDRGVTLSYLREQLGWRRPASLHACALFEKAARRARNVDVEYTGLALPDVFVIGYGLDYRNSIATCPTSLSFERFKTVER